MSNGIKLGYRCSHCEHPIPDDYDGDRDQCPFCPDGWVMRTCNLMTMKKGDSQ